MIDQRIKLIIIFFTIAFASLGARVSQIDDLRVGSIEIVISGKSTLAKEQMIRTIQNRMKTKQGESFSQASFDADLKMLSQNYDRIEPIVEIQDGKIAIKLIIWPNPLINRICWEGNKRLKTKRLQSELAINVGDVYNRQDFNNAFHKLKAYYVSKGFFEADLDYNVVIDDETNLVDITITINEGRAGKIKGIIFNNFTPEEKKCLLGMMATKKYNFFLSWITGSGVYNDDMILHDKFLILNYLQNEGYADATVDLKVIEAAQEDRIILCITAERGKRYYFDTITIEGNQIYSNEELLGCIPIKKGEPYSPEKLSASVQILTNYYGRNGFIDAFINYVPTLEENGCSYKIQLQVEEGDQYRIGLIKVMGNRCTQTKVILHETLLIPGEVFNLEKLQLTERRLNNIGFFDNVNVYAVKSSEDNILPGCYRDVHIEVEEGSTGNLGASLGFSSAEDLFGSINITECNFNIKGLGCLQQTGLCGLRGGGEYAFASISVGEKSMRYGLSWTKPYFMDTPWSVGFDIDRSVKEYISNKYTIKAVGLSLHSTYECNAFMRVGTHYRIRYTYIDIDNDDDDCSRMTKKSKKEAEASDGMISALGYSWQYNTTNDLICPTKGLKSTAQFEIVGLGGDSHFISCAYLNCWYYDLWGKAIFKVRGDMRYIQPMRGQSADTIPLDERFFLGGDNQIRGYYPYRLGPKFEETTCKKKSKDGEKNDDEDPKGGISMQLFSLELSKPLFGLGDAFLFFDAGALSTRKWNFGRFYFSSGIGARVQVFGNGSPPLMVGYGWPINPRDPSDVKRFFITVGGKF